jgi:hypothetical protein
LREILWLEVVDGINIEDLIDHESELRAISSLICALEIRMSGAYSSIQFMKLLRCKQGSKSFNIVFSLFTVMMGMCYLLLPVIFVTK